MITLTGYAEQHPSPRLVISGYDLALISAAVEFAARETGDDELWAILRAIRTQAKEQAATWIFDQKETENAVRAVRRGNFGGKGKRGDNSDR